jgi:hypothetical protein
MEHEIAKLLEGELPEPRRSRLLRHLDDCPGCAQTLQQFQETDRLLTASCPTPVVVPPDAARTTFKRAVAASGILKRRSPWGLRWGIAAAVGLLGAGLAWPPMGGRNQDAGVPVAQHTPRTDRVATNAHIRQEEKAPGVAASRSFRQVASAGTKRRAVRRSTRWRHGTRRPLFRLAKRPPLRPAPKPAPLLIVKMTAGQPAPLLEVTSREAPPETPGFARAGAWHPAPDGTLIWTQATVATDRPTPELVLLPSLTCD